MTFDELRKMLEGGAVRAGDGLVACSCEVPSLPPHALKSLDGVRVVDTGFPGCFCFNVRVTEGDARYIGVVSVGPGPVKHSKGVLQLYLPLGRLDHGKGDYTAERHGWLDALSPEHVKALLAASGK